MMRPPTSPLTPEEAARVPDLFAEASALPAEQQASYLAQACAGAPALRAEVESLLGFGSRLPEFLARPALGRGLEQLGLEAAGELSLGTMLGDCRVVSLLGVGGMGEVYLAEDTVHGRRVALKLIGQGRAEDVRGRHFRHERKVLAALNHPHIARLIGSGITPGGQAYLIMEYVEGERLDKFCESCNLTIAARLALFRKVCAAVTYAHQNLVVHRDLKPANIRVTPEGEPKLLDFGIAKLLDPEGTTASARADPTLTMQGAMTPEYASPEQLKGEPITTATDVYSLGVVLYELLCGQRPFAHLRGRRPDELARAVCEEEPPRPSTVAGRTHPAPTTTPTTWTRPAAWHRQLAGDLDNIVAKALQKDPARRYPSVLAFSEDLRRHDEGLPVRARRDTFSYRAGKFVRRNKVGVAAVTFVVLALVTGLGVAIWQAHNARLAQRQTQLTNEFLQKILRSAGSDQMGKDVKVIDVLNAAAHTVDQDLADEPEALLQAHLTLGTTYKNITSFGEAAAQYRAALALARRLHGEQSVVAQETAGSLGMTLAVYGQYAEAEPLLRQSVAWQEKHPSEPEFRLDQSQALAFVLGETHRFKEAELFLAKARAIAAESFGKDSVAYMRVCNVSGALKRNEGDLLGALAAFQEAIAISNRVSPNSIQVIPPEVNVCSILYELGRLDEMKTATEKAEQDCRRFISEKSPMYATAVGLGGIVDFCLEDYTGTVSRTQQALAVLVSVFPPESLSRVQMEALLGLSLTRLGQPREGEPHLRAAYDHGGQVDKVDFAHTVGNLESALGECLFAQGRYAEAEPLLLTGYDDLQKRLGPQNRFTLQARQHLHDLYLAWNKPKQAAHFTPAALASPQSAP